MTTADLYAPYTSSGTPQTVWAYNGGNTRRAVVVYACYIRDPMYEREPTAAEMRLLVEYCSYWINAPILVQPRHELRELRLAIVRVTTAEQLANWLEGVAGIGLGNVLGGGS
jgi:hypothetical protein